jgi:hypothetical protein
MQLSRKTLNVLFWRLGAAALVMLIVLNLLDMVLRARTGFGTADLQGLATGWAVRVVLDRWTSPPDAALAGFALGLDYLFMPLYGTALYLGAIAACERFAPTPGLRRRILAVLAMAPVAGALCDGLENALQMTMWIAGPTDTLARLALQATSAKYAGITVGLVLSLVAIGAQLMRGTGKKAP